MLSEQTFNWLPGQKPAKAAELTPHRVEEQKKAAPTNNTSTIFEGGRKIPGHSTLNDVTREVWQNIGHQSQGQTGFRVIFKRISRFSQLRDSQRKTPYSHEQTSRFYA